MPHAARPNVLFLTDEDIRAWLSAPDAIATMREALLDQVAGHLVAPPRAHTQFADGRLVFTTGARDGRWFGYRSYDSFGLEPGEQVVVLHEATHGQVRAIAVGNALGPLRTGAIGGVAADELARRDATSVALIGAGTQAWTQLWALAAVRTLTDVRVFARNEDTRTAFAQRATLKLNLPVRPAGSAAEAVTGADIVVLATSSPTPVIDSSLIEPGVYVATLGPKQVGRAEFDTGLLDRADIVVTDSIAQIAAYDPPNILAGTPQGEQLVGLGAVLAGQVPGRTAPDQRTLFCSVGLAGTEVALLAHLAAERLGQVS